MADLRYADKNDQVTELEKKNSETVRRIVGEAAVLLKNDDNILPLPNAGKVALFGNAARNTIKGGTGSGCVNSRIVVNIEAGLENEGFTITTKKWLDEYDAHLKKSKEEYKVELEKKAKEMGTSDSIMSMEYPFIERSVPLITNEHIQNVDTDIAIYGLARISGEGSDRFTEPGDYNLMENEIKNLTFLGQHFKKVIVLLNIGGVIDGKQIEMIPGIGCILYVCQAGNQTGNIVADLLLGKVSPSGKLSTTWALNYNDYPYSSQFSHQNKDWHDEYYKEGIYVGYRYFDRFNITPQYCFGYGLGYSTFSIENYNVEADHESITVKATVKNTGSKYSGREVVQVYVSAPNGHLPKPVQVLVGFGKSKTLKPGETDEVTIKCPLRYCSSYCEEHSRWILEEGTYIVRAGNSSRTTSVVAKIELDKTVILEQLKKVIPTEKFEEISIANVSPYRPPNEEEQLKSAKVLKLSASSFTTKTVEYHDNVKLEDKHKDHKITMQEVIEGKYTVQELVAQLTVKEMASMCVGKVSAEFDSAIGQACALVPGAAGETSSILKERGVENLILADGPAGLRLTPHFRTDSNGKLRKGGETFGDLVTPIEPFQPGDIDWYQYCTAIPIATMLANSWDANMLEEMGKIVGCEMKKFHVHLWLAPGMNIHRNPLCGRNFEYFSEDPVLSGLCAYYETKGVQSIPGLGVTIKHFFCNNSEDNRCFINEHVNERALREIYLRNFQIAIENCSPYSIMTSYNLVNGIHAANHTPVLHNVVHNEWGYKGVIMTDWCTTMEMSRLFARPNPRYDISSSKECINAGNDLQMPGCKENEDDIIQGVENGEVKIENLQACAVNVLQCCYLCQKK
ncbi:hypothetical protein M9Y10_026352 [Tritrichomonas musculus]|uniref:beta-glucosidase n=1 Tax=Tritrichomonas musculus TaxID=1915356 RepID=A0ABR2H7C9_9EUKA